MTKKCHKSLNPLLKIRLLTSVLAQITKMKNHHAVLFSETYR